MAAGINDNRGDAIVVQPLDQLGIKTVATPPAVAPVVAQPVMETPVPVRRSFPCRRR